VRAYDRTFELKKGQRVSSLVMGKTPYGASGINDFSAGERWCCERALNSAEMAIKHCFYYIISDKYQVACTTPVPRQPKIDKTRQTLHVYLLPSQEK